MSAPLPLTRTTLGVLIALSFCVSPRAAAQVCFVRTLAGLAPVAGSADGVGSAARFSYPTGVAVDAAGVMYVADNLNHTIRRILPNGTVTTLAGLAGVAGAANGVGSAARFNFPHDVAVDAAGVVYVADSVNSTIRKILPNGTVSTLAGLAGVVGSADGVGSAARFGYPWGLAVDAVGVLYVGDQFNANIRKILPNGTVTTLAGLAGSFGFADGVGTAARFNYPSDVAVDAAGVTYVADANNHTIRRVLPNGTVTTLAGLAGSSGSADGVGSAARFNHPTGLTVNWAGVLFVADDLNNTIRKVLPNGTVTTLAGLATVPGSADGIGSLSRFRSPRGVAARRSGILLVSDTVNRTIRMLSPLPGREFDADNVTDLSVYRPSTGQWFVRTSRSQFASNTTVTFGGGDDVPVPGDFDADGRRDAAVYRPVSGTWFWLKSLTSNTTFDFRGWGVQAQGDVAAPGDYDGDGKTDLTVFRPAFGTWFILKSSSNNTQVQNVGWGTVGDVLMQGDYDGDGRTDMAVFRPATGQWFIKRSSTSFTTSVTVTFGNKADDVPVHGDFDGDGKKDIAVYRPSTGTWFWLKSSANNLALDFKGWGVQAQGDVPVPGDYDGDGKTDPTVYRPDFGTWFVLKSSASYTKFVAYGWGNASDIPLGGQR